MKPVVGIGSNTKYGRVLKILRNGEVNEWDLHGKNGFEKCPICSQGLNTPRRIHNRHVNGMLKFDWVTTDSAIDDGTDGFAFNHLYIAF